MSLVTYKFYDIETTGLLYKLKQPDYRVHCLWIFTSVLNTTTGEFSVPVRKAYVDKSYIGTDGKVPGISTLIAGTIEDGIEDLMLGDIVVAHNGIRFDSYVLANCLNLGKKLHLTQTQILDTLVLVRMLFSDIDRSDYQRVKATKNHSTPFLKRYIGRHSLEAWGARIGVLKGEYVDDFIKAETERRAQEPDEDEDELDDEETDERDAPEADYEERINPWKTLNQAMLSYCENDVECTFYLFVQQIFPRLFIKPPSASGLTVKYTYELPIYPKPDKTAIIKHNTEGVKAGFKVARPNNLTGHAFMPIERTYPYNTSTRGGMLSITVPIEDVIGTHAEYVDAPAGHYAGNTRRNDQTGFRIPTTTAEQKTAFVTLINEHHYGVAGVVLPDVVALEHRMEQSMANIEHDGIPFNREKAQKLDAELRDIQSVTEKKLEEQIRPRVEPVKWIEPGLSKRTISHEGHNGKPSVNYSPFSRNPSSPRSGLLAAWRIRCEKIDTIQELKNARKKVLAAKKFAKENGLDPDDVLSQTGYITEYKASLCTCGECAHTPLRGYFLTPNKKDPNKVGKGSLTPNLKNPYPTKPEPRLMKFHPVKVNSRSVLVPRLLELGWVPETFTPTGTPSIDESSLSKIDSPLAKDIERQFLVGKRLGQLSNGNGSWLNLSQWDGKLHPNINPHGAVTARATHSKPNISAVPAVELVKVKTQIITKTKEPYEYLAYIGGKVQTLKTKLLETTGPKEIPVWGEPGKWGADCRALFEAFPGQMLVGCDLAALELRMLANRLYPFDRGRFLDILLNEDVHANNATILGISRTDAKRFIFAFLYGAGPEKLGWTVNSSWTIPEQIARGKEMIDRMLSGFLGLKDLIKALKAEADSGFIRGLDGRFIPVRAQYAALNTALQSDGALVSKYWIDLCAERCTANDWKRGPDWRLLIWSHDELQKSVREDLTKPMAELMVDAARRTGELLKLAIPLDAEAKIGRNWAETH